MHERYYRPFTSSDENWKGNVTACKNPPVSIHPPILLLAARGKEEPIHRVGTKIGYCERGKGRVEQDKERCPLGWTDVVIIEDEQSFLLAPGWALLWVISSDRKDINTWLQWLGTLGKPHCSRLRSLKTNEFRAGDSQKHPLHQNIVKPERRRSSK